MHYALLDYSSHVANYIKGVCVSLHDKDDASFTDAVFRVAIMHLHVHPGLNARQFLSPGFVERKLLFIVDLIRAVVRMHEESSRAAASSRAVLPYTSHHMLEPGSATTATGLGLDARLEPEPHPNDLQPPLAHALPGHIAREKGRPGVQSGVIYSVGASAAAASGPEAVYRVSTAG